jgi:hypothetical protein
LLSVTIATITSLMAVVLVVSTVGTWLVGRHRISPRRQRR